MDKIIIFLGNIYTEKEIKELYQLSIDYQFPVTRIYDGTAERNLFYERVSKDFAERIFDNLVQKIEISSSSVIGTMNGKIITKDNGIIKGLDVQKLPQEHRKQFKHNLESKITAYFAIGCTIGNN